ncbi:MAG: hypothetical protein ACM3NH_01610 [Candidatus Saccharibacteria bacterium]
MGKPNYFKLLIAAGAVCYFGYAWLTPSNWRFLDYVNLVLHEAGHPLMIPFGETASVLGGTLFQLAIPAVFAAYFYWRNQKYSAGIVMFWLAESLGNVSIYAKDALRQQLPLLGGEGTIHDWNYLLLNFGMLRHANGMGEAVHIAGLMALAAAVFLTFRYSWTREDKKTGDPLGTA